MSYGWLFVAILVTALVFMLGPAWWTGRKPRVPLARLADAAPLPGELPIAGYLPPVPETADAEYYERKMGELFDLPGTLARFTAPDGPYGPFPADTGPLLILSEKDAANAALEREIPRLCAEAEAKIPPRWR